MHNYNKAEIKKISIKYILQSIGIAVMLSMLTILYMIIVDKNSFLLISVIVSALFTTLIDTVDAILWKIVATRHSDMLPTFFTAVSGFRMLLALLVMLIYYLIEGKDIMIPFFIIFMIFYVAMMIHHSRYFMKLMNGFNINKEK